MISIGIIPFFVMQILQADIERNLISCPSTTSAERGICLTENLCVEHLKGINIGTCEGGEPSDVCCKLRFKAEKTDRGYIINVDRAPAVDPDTDEVKEHNARISRKVGLDLVYVDWSAISSDGRKDEVEPSIITSETIREHHLEDSVGSRLSSRPQTTLQKRKSEEKSDDTMRSVLGQIFREDSLQDLLDIFQFKKGVEASVRGIFDFDWYDIRKKQNLTLPIHDPFVGEFAKCASPELQYSTPRDPTGIWRNTAKECGKGGEQEAPGEEYKAMWPWMASLQDLFHKLYVHRCGAILLTNTWIVTGASCVYRTPVEDLKVRIGSEDMVSECSPCFEDTFVQTVVVHPSYNNVTHEHDIALIKMNASVEYDPNWPICLPWNVGQLEGEMATTLGWEHSTSPLFQSTAPIIPKDYCKPFLNGMNPDYYLCIEDAYERQVGEPMVMKDRQGRWSLVGIKFSIYNGSPIKHYTKISSYTKWIQNTISCFEQHS